MSRRTRPLLQTAGVLVLGLLVVPGVGAAQSSSLQQVQSLSLVTRVLSSAVITLLAGGAYFVFAEESAERTMDRAREQPVESFLWGLGLGIALLVVTIVLAITVIGLVVAIPLLIVFAVVELAAQAVVFVMIVRSLLDSATDVGPALVGAAVVAGVLSAIPLVGPLIQFVVGSVGVGAVAINYRS